MTRSSWKPLIDLINYNKTILNKDKSLLSNVRRFWILKMNVGNKVNLVDWKKRTRIIKIKKNMVGMKLGQFILTKKRVIHRCKKKKKKK